MGNDARRGSDGPGVQETGPGERQLREGILEISPVPIAILDPDRQVVRANDRAKEELGLREDELLGLSPADSALSAVDADGSPIDDDEGITVEILERGEPVRNRVYRVDMPGGRSIWLSISGTPLFDDRGEVRRIVLAFEDITERKQRERRFNAVFNNTFQFTGLMQPDGTLIEANDTALEFVGADREVVVGTHLAESPWVTDENRDRVYDAADRAREGELVRFEMGVNSAQRNGTVPVDFSLKPVTDEAGEVSVRVPFEAPSHVNVLSHLPAAITTAGPYVAYTGSDAHGCCPSWVTFVVDTEKREFVYRDFARTSDATPQRAGAVSNSAVVHQRGNDTVRRRLLDGSGEFQLDYDPRQDGIATTTDRTFVADGSGLEATNTGENLVRGPTELVAVDNEGYGIAWSHTFDTPITQLQAAGEFLFGVDRAEGRLVAMAQSGDGATLRPAETASETPSQEPPQSTPTASSGAANDGSEEADRRAAADSPAAERTPSRGFLTNGDDQPLEGVGLTGLSIIITIGGILVTLYDMVRGSN